MDKPTLHPKMDLAEEEPDIARNSQLAHFYKTVQQLNKIEKALILLFIEGLSHKEISENLGLLEVNPRVKLNRTKTKLQGFIKRQGYEF